MKKLILFVAIVVFSLSACATRVAHPAPTNTKVVVVKTPPKNYTIVRLKGRRYYKWNGKHYRKTRRGYVYVSL